MNKSNSPPLETQTDSSAISTQTNVAPSVERIEKREMLSLISPHPVHVAETARIPVLNNQMDFSLDSTETHARRPETSNGFVELDYDPENTATTFVEQPTLQQATSSASVSEATNDSSPSSSSSPPSVNKGSASAEMSSNGPSNTHFYQNNRSIPADVDLQALLTRLSPSVPQQPVPLQGTQTPPATTAAQTPPPSQAKSTSLPQPPAPVQAPQTQTAQSQPTHPLPAPPATFAATNSTSAGHASHPANYPASLPPPPNFNQHRQAAIPGSPIEADETEEESRPFTVDEEDEYERFLSDERDYVTQGQWDRFPAGSRLFIGNLPTEKVTKRDLFRIFHRHGRLAQVSIKQAYGFVQFLDISSCAAALRHEQGSTVRGRKMHLEVSKPQRNTRPAPGADTQRRRSRSPDYGRAVSPRGRGSFRGGRGDFSDRSFRRDTRDRDYDYGRRSPPPRHRARDDWRPSLRSRSRSPPPTRYRVRSRSPVGETLPPRRDPKDVPDVQAIVTDELDRNFIWWVEKAFRERGLAYDLLYLHPRMPLDSVIKQQILEGVQAIVFLDIQKQRDSTISLQVFNRHGSAEAGYDRYDNIEPAIGAELVIRAKQAHVQQAQVPALQYNYMAQQPFAQLGSLLGSMDPGTLNRLLTSLQNQAAQQQQGLQQNPIGQQQQQPPPPSLTPDLAALLGQASSAQTYGTPQLGVNTGYGANPQAQAGLAALLAGQAQSPVQPAPQQQAPNGQMQNIMETLAKWKQG